MLPLRQIRRRGEELLDSFDRRYYTDFGRRFRNWRLGVHRNDYVFRTDQWAFVHLPKTGGTSLNTVLLEHGGDRFTGVFRHRPVSRRCAPGRFTYFTVMRDPVERVWSFYQMALRSLSRAGGPYGYLAERGLEFFLTRCWEVRNMACRYYSGRLLSEPNAATAENAWQNLQRFRRVLDFASLTDDANDFLAECGLADFSLPHENSHTYQGPVSAERRLIEKFNALDLGIYRRWAAFRDRAPSG